MARSAGGADGGPACDVGKATTLGAAADRSSARGLYGDAAHGYRAATCAGGGCRTSSDALLDARLRPRTAVAFGQSGDFSQALTLVHTVEANLAALAARDPRSAPTVNTLLGLAGELTTALGLAERLWT